MATEKTTEPTNGADQGDDGALVGVVNQAQGAAQATAGAVKNLAGTAAERLPAAVSTAQDVSSRTTDTLDEMPDQALVAGTAFSLGLAVGLFVGGANRLFVIGAAVPAALMAFTLSKRDSSAVEEVADAVKSTAKKATS